MDYRLWDSSRSRVPHTTNKLRAKAFLIQFSFTDASYIKTFGAPILQYLFKNLVLFLGQENILHGRTALASIQVDTYIHNCLILVLYRQGCCAAMALLHDYHFILQFAMLYLALYTQAHCKQDRRTKVSLNSVTYLYSLKPNCDSSTPSSILKI